jgi:aminoglycoside phosphotransferase (APT) family kinase protein
MSAIGKEPIRWYRPHTGLSSAQCFVVRLADGSSIFVKAAVDETTERQLRFEHEILCSVSGEFVPRPLAWVEAGDRPVLVVEDLSAAHWPADRFPVTWKPGQFDLLFETLRQVAETTPPRSLPPAEAAFEAQWPAIAREADRFLALGLCSATWFRAAIDRLVEVEAAVPLAGNALVHNDVRSDNLCFVGERVVLVDWGGALRGHRHHDLAASLTTLPLEGGPEPFDVLPEGGAWAAYHAARSARRAYLPAGLNGKEQAPEWFRKVLQRIAAICLSWAARSLDLPPWTGLHWSEIR